MDGVEGDTLVYDETGALVETIAPAPKWYADHSEERKALEADNTRRIRAEYAALHTRRD